MRLVGCLVCLVACEKTEVPPDPSFADGVDLPQVTTGFEPAHAKPPAYVIVDKANIRGDKGSIVAIANGEVDASALEGGKHGMKITALAAYIPTLRERAGDGRVAVLLDRATPYATFIKTLYSLKQKVDGKDGFKHFDVYARANGALVSVPIALPESAARHASASRVAAANDPADQLTKLEDGAMSKRVSSDVRAVAKLTPSDSSLTTHAIERKVAMTYGATVRGCTTRQGVKSIEIGFEVDATGLVRKASVKPAAIATCLQPMVEKWRFAVPSANGKPIAVAVALIVDLESDPPPMPTSRGPEPEEPGRPLGLFVSVMASQIIVWSITQLEGTLRQPKASIAVGPNAAAELHKVIAEIANRRYGGKPRDAGTNSIVIQADARIPMQTIAEVIGAVRKAFPDIQFSSGFE